MKAVIVTGSGGLIGSETARHFLETGYRVVGIDNNLREYFFGSSGSTMQCVENLRRHKNYVHSSIDLRNRNAVLECLKQTKDVAAIIHTAAQPSHDWAAKEPFTDFDVNAGATLNVLEAYRQNHPDAVFIFTSTNKVYGDKPNEVRLVELPTRFEFDVEQSIQGVSLAHGISEEMSIDNSTHSIFGASKVAADILCQEYGRYFNLPVGVFRGGCLTGPQHSSVELHGFLSYIVKCAVLGRSYTIFGYKGKQVRDQVHSADVVNAFLQFMSSPKPGQAYNLGGGKANSASILEVIALLRERHGLEVQHSYVETNRIGDHICYYSDLRKLQNDFPNWRITHSLEDIVDEIVTKELAAQRAGK